MTGFLSLVNLLPIRNLAQSEREDQHISQKHSDQSKNIPSFEEKSEEANQRVLINQRSA